MWILPCRDIRYITDFLLRAFGRMDGDQGRKIESYFLNELTRNLCITETHYKQRQQTVKSALIERQSINLDFGIDLD